VRAAHPSFPAQTLDLTVTTPQPGGNA
jgi:hypothetical protein